jgi:glycosyltransferase involved in cell wall biosynthesis
MRIVQTVFGVFHHFELARELDRRGQLERVYSTWPWSRLKREGLPRDKVETFPWLHVPEYLLHRSGVEATWATDQLGYANALAFDVWTQRQLRRSGEHVDALIGISGSSLKAGQNVQRADGVFVCDRGSTHHRFQDEILRAEFDRWGVDLAVGDPRDTAREEAIYETANAITVASTFAKRSFVEQGVSPAKVHVIPYGVRLERFSPGAPPSTESFDVLFAGWISLRKGIPYLLEAFKELKHPKKKLRLVGVVAPDVKQLLHRLPMEDVEILGPLPQAELAQWMRKSHVLVLPSVEDGFGLVLTEAMACGCPVISSTNTGAADLYQDGKEGFIVPARDASSLRCALQRLVDESGLQERMREEALAKVQSLGGWTDYGDRWETLLRVLTGESESAAN